LHQLGCSVSHGSAAQSVLPCKHCIAGANSFMIRARFTKFHRKLATLEEGLQKPYFKARADFF